MGTQAGGADISFWLPTEGENKSNPVPEPAQKLLHVLNMSEKELEECLATGKHQKPLTHGDELGIVTKFLWLLQQTSAKLEGVTSLEDDVAILESLSSHSEVPTMLWHCVLYRAGHKRIVRGYRKAARLKLDKIIAAMNEQRAV